MCSQNLAKQSVDLIARIKKSLAWVIDPRRTPACTQIIVVTCVILPTIVIQWCLDGRIGAYQERLSLYEARRSQYLQLATFHKGNVHFYEISGLVAQLGGSRRALQITEAPIKFSGDKEADELLRKYEEGKISAGEYLNEMGNLSRKRNHYYQDQVNQLNDEIKKLRLRPPGALKLKTVLHLVQVIGACVVAILNARLLQKLV